MKKNNLAHFALRNGVGVIHFCAPENGELHKIVQPFLRGHVFLCILISVPQKETTLTELKTSQILLLSK